MKIARVALDVPMDTLFDYLLPEDAPAVSGVRVEVPFGQRQAVGVVVELATGSRIPAEKLKFVTRVFRDGSELAQRDLEFMAFLSRYYRHPLGSVVMGALPGRLRTARPAGQPGKALYHLTPAGETIRASELPARAVAKQALIAALQRTGALTLDQARRVTPRAVSLLREFLRLGWAKESHEAKAALPRAEPPPPPPPTPEQAQAVAAITSRLDEFRPWLLQGVTGSGKTEVYLQTISRVLQRGRQALVLVPEIGLTPQVEALFRQRLPGASIVTQHSGLPASERTRSFLAANSGRADLVLGTRSAVFTPLPRLGLIVVDEEHDASFKQQEGLRYSARDAAVFRAQQAGVPLILGSATPSLETLLNVQRGRYQRLKLTRRAGTAAALPRIGIVDMRRSGAGRILSETLLTALEARLARGEQSLVFVNRRGYAPVLLCRSCGWSAACTRCAARLAFHAADSKLRCHHCGKEAPVARACPHCGNPDLRPLGHGTQRLEEALAKRFPQARILRVDSDSTRRRLAWQEMREKIQSQAVDILVGTQMLAKGHDFPLLTLVGVVDPDSALFCADFRASERLFAQLVQVAGRAGRADAPGEVLIQTQFPDHPLFRALLSHDYEAFAEQLLAERRQAGFPPFVHQALLRAESAKMETALEFLERAARAARPLARRVAVYDPVPALLARVAGKARAQLLVQSASRKDLQSFLAAWHPRVAELALRKVRFALDVDPLEL